MENPGPEQLKDLPKVTIPNSRAALLTAVLSYLRVWQAVDTVANKADVVPSSTELVVEGGRQIINK